MKRIVVLKIFLILMFFAASPNLVFCIDLDSLIKDKPTSELRCLKTQPPMREIEKGCEDFNKKIGDIIKITKEDLFNKIRDDLRATSDPTVDDLSFGSRAVNWSIEPPKYVINGNEYYACDIFASIFINSYGFKGDPERESVYYVCYHFSEFTKLLASFYEEKRKNPNATPDEIVEKLRAWQTGDDPNISRSLHKDDPHTVKTLIAFAKDYDKFLESIVPEYSQKKDQMGKNKQLLVAKQEAEKKQKNEEQNKLEIQRINNLLKKWANFGIPKEILSSQLKTYAGASISGYLGAFVELIDKIPGLQKCTKKDDLWMCSQKNKDVMTGKSNDIKYAFYDMRKSKGYIWLERVVINGQDFPSNKLFALVVKLLGK